MRQRLRLVTAGLIMAAAALPAQAAVTARRLASGVVLLAGEFAPGHQPDGNSIVLRGDAGLVVVDTGRHSTHSNRILAAAAQLRQPIVAVINTHWHLDHVSGNPRLRSAVPGLKVYASNAIDGALKDFLAKSAHDAEAALAAGQVPADLVDEVRADIATTANGVALRPDVVVGENQRLKLAGRRIDVHLAHSAVTAGDLWLIDEQTGTLIAGDLVTLPVPFLDTACPTGWRAALDGISAARFTRLVPGHGAVMNRREFETWRQAFGRLMDCTATARREASCSEGWAQDLGTLLPASEQRRAAQMAQYYVRQLRAQAGRNPNCNLV
ncbi:MBL fold metallo-hydrolase [Sandarakinorhabdus rubra]|uniref:MBL fold metallo-hydrolase n=1 Tax=Sandarakinorhabdus rubra TaxID=2672568 RepID=UPI0013DCCEF9|nr:MBL fold metallo-hydrolase [Sandarakinorhabdus rubra]